MKILTDEEIVIRGDYAHELLRNDCYLECMQELHTALHSGLDDLQTDDTEAIMSIVRQIRTIKNINVKLTSWVQAAKLIRIQND